MRTLWHVIDMCYWQALLAARQGMLQWSIFFLTASHARYMKSAHILPQVGGLKAGSAAKKGAAGKQPGGASSSSRKRAKVAPGQEEPDDSVRCRMAGICEGAAACQPDGALTDVFRHQLHRRCTACLAYSKAAA